MKFEGNDRKITGDKFVITLPQDWREALGLQPGNYVTAIFHGGSPLVLIPRDADLDQLQQRLIKILTEGLSAADARIMSLHLQDLATRYDGIAQAQTIQ